MSIHTGHIGLFLYSSYGIAMIVYFTADIGLRSVAVDTPELSMAPHMQMGVACYRSCLLQEIVSEHSSM